MMLEPTSSGHFCLRTAIGCVSAAFVAGVLLASCDDSETKRPSGSGAETFAQTSCSDCFLRTCAEPVDACRSDPGCAAYLDCLGACPVDEEGFIDPDCDVACSPTTSSEATRAQAEVVKCRTQDAAAACLECAPAGPVLIGGQAQLCEPRDDEPFSPCSPCYWENCCDTWDACFGEGADPDCDALASCVALCVDAPLEPCVDACFAAHPASVETLLAQNGCAMEFCAKDQIDCNADKRSECDVCLFDTCGPMWVDLMSNPDGFLLFACLGDCGAVDGGVTCVEACFDAHPGAEYAGYLWAECVAFNCESSC
jgi:hypothetical protein